MNKEKDLQLIKKLIEERKAIDNEAVAVSRAKMNKILKDFISTKHLIVYGGIALNSIVSQKDKFYTDTEFSDYDCLSYNAKQHAKELADIFYSEGFEYTEVKDALHSGTYKIFVNFVPVADITQVGEKFFLEILKLSEIEKPKLKYFKSNINIAPTFLLKHFLLRELARPDGSLHRWKKVYERATLLEKVMPKYKDVDMNQLKLVHEEDEGVQAIIKDLYQIIKLRKYPVIGNVGLGVLLGKNQKEALDCCRIDKFFSVFEIIASDPLHTYRTIFKFLNFDKSKYQIKISKRYFYQEILPKRLRIYLHIKGRKEPIKLMTIMDTETNCYSVIQKNGIVIGSPYTILQFYYAYWLVYRVYEDTRIHKMVESYINVLEKYIREKSSSEERFTKDCFGHERTIITLKKEKWNQKEKQFIYRPKTKKH